MGDGGRCGGFFDRIDGIFEGLTGFFWGGGGELIEVGRKIGWLWGCG
jgi:hypothetical protein